MKKTKGYIYIATPFCNKLVATFEAIGDAYICVTELNNACNNIDYHYFVTNKKI